MTTNEIGHVLSCAPASVVVEVANLKVFEASKDQLQVGRYLQIAQGNTDFTIAIIINIKGVTEPAHDDGANGVGWKFLIECQPIGSLDGNGVFHRGSVLLPVPTEPAYLADKGILDKLFICNDTFNLPFGRLSMNKEAAVYIDGDRFFGKHIGVAGSTGSGKSCTVAKMLQQVVGIEDTKNRHVGGQKNAHVVIFDIHSEYESAFSLHADEKFTLNVLDIDTLQLPYWLMNSEELETIFIESNEANSHNQVSQFKHAVILNKEKHNPTIKDMTYDNPVFFSIEEVHRYIENMNREIIGRGAGENAPKLEDGTLVEKREHHYFAKVQSFVAQASSGANKATNGPFNGEFNRFTSRLESKLSDKRLRFLLHPTKTDGKPFETADFEHIMKQFLGYLHKANVTIVDLSGVPFEVLSITVSLIARLVFDFCFHYSKLCHEAGNLNDVPVLIVCEEAHNYVPQKDAAAYRASRQSIERIAKEGRKYGLSLMAVSQRPSEVSETIFSQCNNFVSLRLTNSNDQAYIRRLLPDSSSAICDVLPNLGDGECVLVGDAVPFPAVVQMDMPSPQPQSQTVKIYQEWQKDWKDLSFADVIKRWRKE